MIWPRRQLAWAMAVAVGLAVPLTAVQPVGATAGAMKEYAVPGKPIAQGIAAAADGALWFTDFYTPYVERITTAGKTRRFAFPVSPNIAAEIATGSDGALWVTLLDEIHGQGRIGRITTAGGMSMFSVPGTSYLDDITAGPDGALWFTDNLGKVDRITTSGAISEYTVGGEPYHITTGSDGNLWFTDHSAFRIGRITTAGHVSYFSLPSHAGYPDAIGSGPDGALWLRGWASTGSTIVADRTMGADQEVGLAAVVTPIAPRGRHRDGYPGKGPSQVVRWRPCCTRHQFRGRGRRSLCAAWA
jgi:streptogramin lyase